MKHDHLTSLFTRHEPLLSAARNALSSRNYWTGYGEEPPEPARGLAQQEFSALLSTAVLEDHPGTSQPQDDELSPFTREGLGMSYPHALPAELITASSLAWESWRALSAEHRLGVCLEMLDRLFQHNELHALAAHHTTGQSTQMSRSGSGTNALDRGLEAVAMAANALDRVPDRASWMRQFGKERVSLEKRYCARPLGTALVVACASFPSWNTYPALFANLATGNPVIVKPHPSSVLHMALAVGVCRQVLREHGLPADTVLLAADTFASPVTKELATHQAVRIIDFTGSAEFGGWIESNATQALVFTETSGANSVILESVDEIAPVLRTIAGTACLFSAQMCTSPQNIYVPDSGVLTSEGLVTPTDIASAFVASVQAISQVPRRAAPIMGAVQSERTVREVQELAREIRARGRVLLDPLPYTHPDYPHARTSGPLVALVDESDSDLYDTERFGHVLFVIRTRDRDSALSRAAHDAAERGAITAFLFTTDDDFLNEAEECLLDAGAAVTSNLTGAMPLNFSAAFSDFHVSGLNPAGTATLTDESFIAGRFRIAQARRPSAASFPPLFPSEGV